MRGDNSTLEHYIFMESYHDAMRALVSQSSNYESYGRLMYCINEFVLYGEEPDTSAGGGLNDTELMIWKLVKPILERTRTKALAGKTGGSKSKAFGNHNAVKQSKNKAKTKQKQTDKDKDKDKDNIDTGVSMPIPPYSDSSYSKYIEWRKRECPHLSSMDEMSEREFATVCTLYGKKAVLVKKNAFSFGYSTKV